ncbi:hypothetical protein VTO42DRAFT_6172 [Malbranchea cinnamomea]
MLTGLLIVLAVLLGFGGLLAWVRPTSSGSASKRCTRKNLQGHIQLLVLGDIGHSPRMRYHAQSIAKHGCRVSIIGYRHHHHDVSDLDHPLISIIPLPPPPSYLQTSNKFLFPIFALCKLIHQSWCLWWVLLYRCKPAQWMVVQNPPAAPTFILAHLVCWLRNTRLVIDWHNFGYSILALKLGKRHPAVQLMKAYEKQFSHFATAHFCVSKAMARILREEMGIRTPVLVLYDRPASIFQPITSCELRDNILQSLSITSASFQDLKTGRCQLLVSSTSWTSDEDFSILLDALCQYADVAASTGDCSLPSLLVVITGKGPLRDLYLSKIAALTAAGKLAQVTIRVAWLNFEDYARLLACASLGVCLHTSSSGVDLPMKVVDMFGAGLPVVGWNKYESWPELVTEGVNGRGFGSAEELASHLVNLLGSDAHSLKKLRDGAIAESRRRWDDEWDPVAGRLFGMT